MKWCRGWVQVAADSGKVLSIADLEFPVDDALVIRSEYRVQERTRRGI